MPVPTASTWAAEVPTAPLPAAIKKGGGSCSLSSVASSLTAAFRPSESLPTPGECSVHRRHSADSPWASLPGKYVQRNIL